MKHLIKLPFIALLLSALYITSCSSDADLLDFLKTSTDQTSTTENIDSCSEKSNDILYMHTIYPATDSTPKYIIKTPVKIIKSDDTRTSRVLRASNDTIKTTITEDHGSYTVLLEYKKFFVKYQTLDLSRFPGPSEWYLYEHIGYYADIDEAPSQPTLSISSKAIKISFYIYKINETISEPYEVSCTFYINEKGEFCI